MSDRLMRKNLIDLLTGGEAHIKVEKVLQAVNPQARNRHADGMEHSVWQVFEHMRLAQEDILRYTLDPNWVSPPFPEGYWPASPDRMTEADWNHAVARFFADQKELIQLVEDTNFDLTDEIPHGEGRTYLRQILLVADHNAYHLGQIVQLLKALGSWNG